LDDDSLLVLGRILELRVLEAHARIHGTLEHVGRLDLENWWLLLVVEVLEVGRRRVVHKHHMLVGVHHATRVHASVYEVFFFLFLGFFLEVVDEVFLEIGSAELVENVDEFFLVVLYETEDLLLVLR
jgi:hypothetical protein